MEYYLALKRKEILTQATARVSLGALCSAKQETRKDEYGDSARMASLEESDLGRKVAGRVLGPGEGAGDRVSVWEDE